MIKRYNETPRDLLIKRWPNLDALSKEIKAYVEKIVEDVRIRGDEAVRYYTKKFDNVDISELRISPEIIQSAYNEVTKEQIEALKELKRRIEIVEAKRLSLLPFNIQVNKVDIHCSIRPLHSVGCYVPGGKATYPSSLVMNVVPARIAGVKEISVCTPPGENGEPSALTLVAADLCGVETVYNVGGIQAIASMAYGTDTISKVDKIIGPGNKYVTAAKIMV